MPTTATTASVPEIAGQHKQTFTYDNLDRITNVEEKINNNARIFNFGTTYDEYGRVKREIFHHSNDYYTENTYDSYGNLTEVKDNANRSIWKAVTENERRQLTKETKGSKNTEYGYNSNGFLSAIFCPSVIDMEFSYNSAGNLIKRKDYLNGSQDERFDYDDNRLNSWEVYKNNALKQSNSIVYEPTTGNIQSKSDVGYTDMRYGEVNNKPHALTSLIPSSSNPSPTILNTTYTDFNKIKTLTEVGSNKSYTITYGVDNQRRSMVYKENNVTKQTNYYASNYEEEINLSGNTRKIHYLYGGAIFIQNSAGGPDSLLYAYTDHLGSLTALTNQAGTVIEKYAYDPWGARRNPNDWAQRDTRTNLKLKRGFTGHEHIDRFGIINMNGRVYDPLIAQFFSPDNHIQAQGNWFNYNRYAYCMNNPLIYTDPSGDLFWLVPSISWSKSGGFGIGLTGVFGFPGGLSAQVGVGYNFKSNDLYAFAGVTAMFNTAYVSASTSSGFSAGWSIGISPYMGFPISTNFTSVGVNYNFTHKAVGGNFSAWSWNEYSGWSFDPSVSLMVFPEQTTNLVRGQGFRSNNQVFDRMMRSPYYCQDILDYFGFEGTYAPNRTSKNYDAESYWGATNPKTGKISYGDLAFENYATLKGTYIKERYHSQKILSGKGFEKLPSDLQGLGYDTYLEETYGYVHAFKRQGLFSGHNFPFNGVEFYRDQLRAFEVSYPTYPNRFQWIYKIPRLW